MMRTPKNNFSNKYTSLILKQNHTRTEWVKINFNEINICEKKILIIGGTGENVFLFFGGKWN